MDAVCARSRRAWISEGGRDGGIGSEDCSYRDVSIACSGSFAATRVSSASISALKRGSRKGGRAVVVVGASEEEEVVDEDSSAAIRASAALRSSGVGSASMSVVVVVR